MEKMREIQEKESALAEERARNQSLAEANNELLRRLRQVEHHNFNSVDTDRAFEDTIQADKTPTFPPDNTLGYVSSYNKGRSLFATQIAPELEKKP